MEKDIIEKPIFIMKRKKGIMIVLYYIFAILWDLATAFVCIIFMTLDNIIPNIIGFIFLAFIPYIFFCMFDIKEVICYEDYFIVKRSFITNKYYYKDFRDKYNMVKTILLNSLALGCKKIKMGIFINLNMFKKNDIDKFIEFLKYKNITKYSLF
ncbi:hypothetical protein F1B92_08175 [Campylobacter sp. FMV-PI01]|uniref:Uncharacterized protein n=1 Tax=Campylobacter portucalensis TaxID=2608384 RepID=A0A6L5WJB9_9BACT|nr:hypothetical protein [Campylobacter portucalensis]MSN97134.1 hypothetical protein [Campylobacter portucalensis]